MGLARHLKRYSFEQIYDGTVGGLQPPSRKDNHLKREEPCAYTIAVSCKVWREIQVTTNVRRFKSGYRGH